jgi:hypothetical protein
MNSSIVYLCRKFVVLLLPAMRRRSYADSNTTAARGITDRRANDQPRYRQQDRQHLTFDGSNGGYQSWPAMISGESAATHVAATGVR